MKRLTCSLIMLCTVICAFCISASAKDANEGGRSTGEYIIKESGDSYTLSFADGSSSVSADTLTECFSLLPREATVILENIRTDKPPKLPEGKYTLVGALSVTEGIFTVPEGCALTLDSLTLDFSDSSGSYMRIKGGSVMLRDSTLLGSPSGAVLLDYLSSSELTVYSGRVTSESDLAAVRAEVGTFCALGGEIVNTKGSAVSCSASLLLAGSPKISGVGYDIVTDRPLTLSAGGVAYSSTEELCVMLSDVFLVGTLTEVLYSSDSERAQAVRIFDREGREYGLTHFASSPYSDEKNFSAVYLPYRVTYYGKTGVFRTEEVLSGEILSAPTAPEIKGYSHSGYYTDKDSSHAYSFGEPVTSDLSLFAGYRLNPPTLKISSYLADYNGASHTLAPDVLTHTLLDEGGFFGYRWYKDGRVVSYDESLELCRHSDSGVYSLEVTFYYSSDSVTVRAENVSFVINKAKVPLPTVRAKYYNGENQSPTIQKSPYYSVSRVSATDAGVYPVELILTDPDNYSFEGTSERRVSVPFEILKAENSWTVSPSVSDIYEGQSPAPEAFAAFGEVVFSYSASREGEYLPTLPTGIGTRFMVASVEESANYTGLLSEPIEFCVLEERLLSLTVKSSPERLSYVAFESFDCTGLLVIASYSGGREEELGASELTVSYQRGDTFLYGDNAVNIGYGGKSCRISVSVSAAEYDLSGLSLSDLALVYNGSYRTLVPAISEIVGKDGYPLKVEINGGDTDVGVYNVTVDFYTQSTNYNKPPSKSYSLEIKPLSVEALWGIEEFVYDGTAKCPTATFVDVLGVSRPLSVLGAKTDAGYGYTATAESYSKNYVITNPTRLFCIKRADYDLSGVSFSSSSFVYDGEKKEVYVQNLPDGLVAVGYTDGSATEAGSYTATVILSYDEKNYNPPKPLSLVWTIHKADYDISGIKFEDTEAVFDGVAHTPSVVGEMPVGADGMPLSYRIDGSATNVSDGACEVKLVFVSNSPNYRAPAPLSAFVRVLPKGVAVIWEIDRYTYNGREQLPSAHSLECEIEVSGAAVNAGKYTVTARAVSPNYRVTNPEAEFEIFKAENRWTELPKIGDFYSSKSPTPTASAYFGEPNFDYYTDEACSLFATLPLSAGRYYMRASIPESENYLPLFYTPVAFTVLEVVLTELRVTLNNSSLVALSPLTDGDFLAVALYNDGEEIPLLLSDLTVSYNGKALPERGDSELSVSYGGKTLTIPVSVGYADYDLSGVKWQNTVTEYNGTPQSPTLSGLPEGITIVGYEGAERTAAGRYTVTAQLLYDTKNYNKPTLPPCEFVINKATVTPTVPAPSVYDGRAKLPESGSPLYTLSYEGEILNAGNYLLKLKLTDPDNYRLEYDTLSFTVLPRRLSVTVGDISRYLGGECDKADLCITDGALVEGDELTYAQIIRDGRVYLVSTNPNYELSSASGSVTERPYPSPRVTRIILLSAFSLAIFVLLLLLAIRGRENIRAGFAAASCRWHNRRLRIPPPRTLSSYPEEYSARPELPQNDRSDNSSSRNAEAPEEKSEKPCTEAYPTELTDGAERKISVENQPTREARGEAHDDPDLFASHHIGEALEALSVDMERADELISDSLAKELVKKSRESVITGGYQKGIINVDTLSESFTDGERVDINILKSKGLLSDNTAYLKVLARGSIDKPLSVYANDFSLSAVKMIALTGGEAVKVVTVKKNTRDFPDNT